MFSSDDRAFMQEALNLAIEAEQNQEVPVGAIIVKDNEIIYLNSLMLFFHPYCLTGMLLRC